MECAYASQWQIPFPLAHASYLRKRRTASTDEINRVSTRFVYSRVGGSMTIYILPCTVGGQLVAAPPFISSPPFPTRRYANG
ncbi:hypothetical protein [Anabaena azotica]|uniref:Uncharacterized protein n=1 Tax=Anabaena azotica FACHB-119 TaxID=947527 RepID=A0ABR8CZ33_9NOST|nr:hypothetical protein [Anabaena azotica]MBD2499235.1 hypothetical protein [Anabaena azotica FACHB-119]